MAGGVAWFTRLVVCVLVVTRRTGVQTLAPSPQVDLALSAAQTTIRLRPQALRTACITGFTRACGHVTIATKMGWEERRGEENRERI